MKKAISFMLAVLLGCGTFAMAGCSKKDKNKMPSPAGTVTRYSDYYRGIDFNTTLGMVAENGRSEYTIVVREDAGECENFAAFELQNYIVQSTGTSVSIQKDSEITASDGMKIISIGKTTFLEALNLNFDYATLNLDGFFLKTNGNSLYIDSGVNRGLLYGVYDYLEKFIGVRFIADDETYVPHRSKLPMYKADIVEVPDFAMRCYLFGDIYATYCDPDYYVHSRTNDSYTRMDAKHGGRSSIYGRNNNHNFHFYCNPDTVTDSGQTLYEIYGDEWFYLHPLYGWTINLLNGITPDGKLDTAMEHSVLKTCIEEMKKDIVENPDIVYFTFDQEDGPFYYPYTEAEDIAIEEKYGRSGILIRFINVMLDELQKWSDAELGGREINIITFAYSYTVTPPVIVKDGKRQPVDETVIADDNLYIRMCVYENPVYIYDDPRQDEATIQGMSDWQMCARHFFLWGYDMDFANYLWYYPNRGKYAYNLKYIKELGYTYAMYQGTQNSKTNWYCGMNSYVVSKLMWDVDRNPTELYDEYIRHYYGETAEPFMHAFFDTFDQHWATLIAEGRELTIYNGSGTHTDAENWPIELLESGCDIMIKAEEAVLQNGTYTQAEKEKYVKRINCVRATPMWMTLRNFAAYYPFVGDSGRIEYLKKFFEVAERGGVDRVSEGVDLATYKRNQGL